MKLNCFVVLNFMSQDVKNNSTLYTTNKIQCLISVWVDFNDFITLFVFLLCIIHYKAVPESNSHDKFRSKHVGVEYSAGNKIRGDLSL